ncbi:MAG: DMT family transporter [Synergistaceae bacterium]|jgi:drug/metabolite transporter (DMT)-like permease|nr:DMT family transporter [Synergistaceae bacterium]
MKTKLRVLFGDAIILLVAFIWGSTNVVIRDALTGLTPFWFCALRFLIAIPVLAICFRKRAVAMPVKARRSGVLLGVVLICSYLSATVALLYTTAGNQSFFLSMPVVFVPLATWFLTRKFPGWHIAAAVILCTLGMIGLMVDENFRVNVGDALCIVALGFLTGYILLVQKYVQDVDPCGLACWQALGAMPPALAAALLLEPFPGNIPAAAWGAVLYSATVGFGLTLVLQGFAQKYTTANHTAILLSMMSVFGSGLGILFLNEPMTWKIFIASSLILAGVLTAEAVPVLRRAGKERAFSPEE